jgi:serine-type D-Ala-D-Ala carboxypeptidase
MIKTDFIDLKNQLDNLFKNSIGEKAFPGAALGFSYIYNNKLQRKIYYYGSIDESDRRVDSHTFYDLASLTKPLMTVLSLLALMKEEKIHWDSDLDSLLSFDVPGEKKKISVFQLMSHRSGLPAHKPYFESLTEIPLEMRREETIKRILKENLLSFPGEKSLYSDLGYILLGHIIEKISERPLDEYWQEKISAPLSLQGIILFPKEEDTEKLSFASTGTSSNKGGKLSIHVHDDNSRMLGGVTGHAGLFGTVEGVLFLCENILLEWLNLSQHPSYSNKELKFALKKEYDRQWTPGFDTPSSVGSSSGKYFSRYSVGHLGFTGTSFWIDPAKKIIIVLLTNRVFWGNENNKIKKIRPLVHDLIMKKLLS